MDSRYDHDYVFDGPSEAAGSGRCRFCGCSDEAEGATLECPFPLRVALDAALSAWKLAKADAGVLRAWLERFADECVTTGCALCGDSGTTVEGAICSCVVWYPKGTIPE